MSRSRGGKKTKRDEVGGRKVLVQKKRGKKLIYIIDVHSVGGLHFYGEGTGKEWRGKRGRFSYGGGRTVSASTIKTQFSAWDRVPFHVIYSNPKRTEERGGQIHVLDGGKVNFGHGKRKSGQNRP